MTDLYLTPHRRALLQEVADEHVVRSAGTGMHLYDHYRPGYDAGISRRLNGRVAELEQAGWVMLVHLPSAPGFTRQVWSLTAAGSDALDGAS